MSKRYSIAEARHNLAALVHDLNKKGPIELTRRGEPVAVLLSLRDYQRLALQRVDFWQAYQDFRSTTPASGIEPEEVFGDVRDRATGREVKW